MIIERMKNAIGIVHNGPEKNHQSAGRKYHQDKGQKSIQKICSAISMCLIRRSFWSSASMLSNSCMARSIFRPILQLLSRLLLAAINAVVDLREDVVAALDLVEEVELVGGQA